MRRLTLYGAATALLLLALPAFADPGAGSYAPGRHIEHRLDRRGDRVAHRLDRRGDRIDHRSDVFSRRAAAAGHDRLAARADRRGDRVDRRLDRRGTRIDRRFDRRGHRAEHHAGRFRR